MSLVLRLLCTLLPMVAMQVLLNATGPLVVFYGFLATGCFIPLLPLPYRLYANWLFFGLGAFIGLALIAIQPLSGFLIWFDLVGLGAMRGPVSVVFMYMGGYLSLAASFGLGPENRLRSFVQVLFVLVLLAFIIFRLGWILALAGVLLPVLVFTALYSSSVPHYWWRNQANLAGLALLASLITIPVATGRVPEGIHLIDEYLSGYLREAVFRYMPEFPVLYGFSGYGHGFSEVKLGGRPLLSERALFAAEGKPGSTYYLRTKIFDTFTGSGWVNSPMQSAISSQGKLSESGAEGSSLPVSLDPGILDPGILDPVSLDPVSLDPVSLDPVSLDPVSLDPGWHILLRLTLLMDYYPLVPQILGATTVLPGRTGDGLVYEGSPAAGLVLARPLVYSERVFVGLRTSLGWEASSIPMLDPADDPEFYLSLPEAVPPTALELATLIRGLPEHELPVALAALFDDGFTYSLDPVDWPKAVNQPGQEKGLDEAGFLQHFLAESRTGYCVHFASAAVLLARLAGVPARYVTGFLVSIPQPEDDFLEIGSGGLVRTELTGLNSHAWVELWFPSTGWTSFEATPPMRQEALAAGAARATTASLDDFTLRQLAAITGGRVDLREAGRAGLGDTLTPAGFALVLLVFGLALFASFVLYRLARQSGWHPGDWVDWWPGNRAAWSSGSPSLLGFSKKARRVVRLAAAMGVPGPERNGWLAWEEDLAALLARHGFGLDTAYISGRPLVQPLSQPQNLSWADPEVFREVFFGCRPPENQDFLRADKLEKHLRGLSKRNSASILNPSGCPPLW